MATDKHLPAVIWAQRADKLYVTINVEDCKNADVKFESDKLIFQGVGGPDKLNYEITIPFYAEIDPSQSKYVILPRHIPMVIRKKETGSFWPRLLKEAKKAHWLKTDFEKWRDEDDSDFENNKDDDDFEEMMTKMGNFNAASAGDDVQHEEDSDDEDLPDLE